MNVPDEAVEAAAKVTHKIAAILGAHSDLAWNHQTGQAICGDCDAALGPFTAEIDEQNRWMRSHQASEIIAAGLGRAK